MVWSTDAVSVEFRDVNSTTSLFFNITLYTLIHIWLGTCTQKSNTNLTYLFFFMKIKFDKLLSEIGVVLQKRKFNLTMSA